MFALGTHFPIFLQAERNKVIRVGVTRKIKICAKLGVRKRKLDSGCKMILSTPQSTLDCERLHGYGAVTKKEHPRYTIQRFLAKLYLAASRNIIIAVDDATMRRLHMQVDLVKRRRPNNANAVGMYLGHVTKRAALEAGPKTRRKRKAVNLTVKKVKKAWKQVPFAKKMHFKLQAASRVKENALNKQEDLEHAEAALSLHQSRSEALREIRQGCLKLEDFRMSAEELEHMETKWVQKRMGRQYLVELEDAIVQPCPKYPEAGLDELTRVRERLIGPSVLKTETPEWVREACRRRFYFQKRILIAHGVFGTKYFRLKVLHVQPHELCAQPLYRVQPASSGMLAAP